VILAKAKYIPRNLAVSIWPNEKVYEFLVVWKRELRSLGAIVEVFARHDAEILMAHCQLDPGTGTLSGTYYCDLAQADRSAEELRKEIRAMSFVQRVEFASTEKSPFDKFHFPIVVFSGSRALILGMDRLLNMEKRLGEDLGSAGSAIMFREGESYAAEVMKGYKLVTDAPDFSLESLLEVAKDGLRATGWGIFDFKTTKEGYEVTVQDAPQLEGSTEPSRFVCGIIAGIVESVFSAKVKVVESKVDAKAGQLFVKLLRSA
jgi:hypothetical protein